MGIEWVEKSPRDLLVGSCWGSSGVGCRFPSQRACLLKAQGGWGKRSASLPIATPK